VYILVFTATLVSSFAGEVVTFDKQEDLALKNGTHPPLGDGLGVEIKAFVSGEAE
jgi:hypothetical protein